ncbi:esterase family protein [uncultured Faecalibaculum sp.]|uniref:esterase family protein n=1 Tax=uncultured Faecalibaculum sp. TaxID=1729681 RepID=UPI0025E49349|nr:alpha/beta hydrolase-fold protein [uncultured Faecalibaculum sp.]
MQVRYFKEYSANLDRDMEFKMYGHAGVLCLVIPCQDGRFFEWEDRKMFDLVSGLVDAGRIQFVTVDSVDAETWSSYGPTEPRMHRLEAWNRYVMDELIPSALWKAGKPQDEQMMVMGASMGAYHAVNLFCRYPHRFSRLLALSGLYDMSRYIYDGNYTHEFHINNPLAYLEELAPDNGCITRYNASDARIVIGQGAWENECLEDTRKLADLFWRKGIGIDTYFWGFDTPHDWPSWERQLQEYLPRMV